MGFKIPPLPTPSSRCVLSSIYPQFQRKKQNLEMRRVALETYLTWHGAACWSPFKKNWKVMLQ